LRSETNYIPAHLTRPRLADGALLVLLAVLTIFSPRFIPAGTLGDILTIKTSDSVYEINLKDEGAYTIDGYLGRAVLVIKDGEARLQSAPCPLKICEAMGPISRSGEVILCLPNRIYIRMNGREIVDAVSR
jgi:hypothetical protein